MLIADAASISESLIVAIVAAVMTGLVTALIVNAHAEKLIEARERRARLDEMRLDLYADVVELIVEYEKVRASVPASGTQVPQDLQAKKIAMAHRITLLGSTAVEIAFGSYTNLITREINSSIQQRPTNPQAVIIQRDELLTSMRAHLRIDVDSPES